MSEFIINDYLLRQEAASIVADILTETQEGDDIQDLIHQSCDGHEWVIYTYKALKLCAECNTTDGEAMLDGMGQTFTDIEEHAVAVAFWTLVCACQDALTQKEAAQ